jgi:hypothetical protein
MSALAEAVFNTAWTLQTPRLARRPFGDWLTGYVSAVLDHNGQVDHYQCWVETGRGVAVASGRDDQDSAAAAVADVDAALITLARVGAR